MARSASHAAPGTRPTTRDLTLVPAFDLRAQPEARTACAKVEDRSWHVGIAPEVEADRVAVG
jgi:hypothetical protein